MVSSREDLVSSRTRLGSTSAAHLVESSSRVAHLAVVDVLHSALALNTAAGPNRQ